MKKLILTPIVCAATLAFFVSCTNTGTQSSGGTPTEQMRRGDAGGSAGGGAGRGTGPSGSTDRPAIKKGRTTETGGATGGSDTGSGTTSTKKKSTKGSSGSGGTDASTSPSPSPSPSE